MIDREQLRKNMAAKAAVPPNDVEIPGWGVKVYVKRLTVAETDAVRHQADAGDPKTETARMLARMLCDESGARLFDESNADDIALLGSQPDDTINVVFAAMNRTNGQDPADVGNVLPPEPSS